jgi:hypothetical protein
LNTFGEQEGGTDSSWKQVGDRGMKMAQIMYKHINKFKNNKRKERVITEVDNNRINKL